MQSVKLCYSCKKGILLIVFVCYPIKKCYIHCAAAPNLLFLELEKSLRLGQANGTDCKRVKEQVETYGGGGCVGFSDRKERRKAGEERGATRLHCQTAGT